MNLDDDEHEDSEAPESLVALPAYRQDEEVEYFSRTHMCWLPASARISEAKEGEPEACTYDVLINTSGQRRLDVPLELLRPPLLPEEPVEVFSRRYGGTWLPATVSSCHRSASTTLGYQVRLDGVGAPMDNVPASRLRRRFLVGEAVTLYCGPKYGWSPRIVERTAQEAAAPEPWASSPSVGAASAGAAQGGEQASGTADATITAPAAAVAPYLWSWVWVVDVGGRGAAQRVPAFLLRRRD